MGGTQNWGGGELGGRIWFIPTGRQRETSDRIHCRERQHGEDRLEGAGRAAGKEGDKQPVPHHWIPPMGRADG